MPNRSTIRDVARIAGVSTATVSRYLNDSGYVNADTSAKIQSAILATGYVPSLMARGLKTQRTRTLLLVLPDICNPFYSRMAQTLQALAQQNNYYILFFDSMGEVEKELAVLDTARSMLAEGIFFAAINENAGVIDALAQQSAAVVGLNAFSQDVPFDTVVVHHAGGTNLAVAHLASLGHRRIAFAGGQHGTLIAQSRLDGYLRQMGKDGLKVDKHSVVEIGFSQEDGYAAGLRFLRQRIIPTAICCANDLIALGLIQALQEAGLRVPEDVSVTGMDDIPYAQISNPRLTSVTNDSALFAQNAFSLMMDRIYREKDSSPNRVEIPNQLIIRGSTAAPAR